MKANTNSHEPSFTKHNVSSTYLRQKERCSFNVGNFVTLKYIRVINDIRYIKNCKKENLVPCFSRVNNGVMNGKKKLNEKVIKLILDTELDQKHKEKRILLKDINEKHSLDNQMSET